MPVAARVIAGSDLSLVPVAARSSDALPRKDQAATDRPVSLKGAIHKNLSARASRFLRQRFGGPNLALLDPACPPCRWGLRPPAFPSEHLAFGQTLGRGWWMGPLGQVSPGGEGGRAASLRAAA